MDEDFRKRWEAGMPHSELSKLYPGHSWRYLANRASKIGARRPVRDDTGRLKVLAYLKEKPNQTIISLTRDLPFSSDNIRYAIRALHKANQIRIVDYTRGGVVYAYGAGDDLSREEWRAARQANEAKRKAEKPRLRKQMVSSKEARVIHSVAVAGMCNVQQHYIHAALFGSV
jgi:hypothetical protein